MMDRRGRLIADVTLAALLLLVPAFLLHSDIRFAGSLAGFVLGAGAAVLIILLLVYPMTKYSVGLKALVTRCVSMPTLLAFHAYAGIVAAFFALLHTGHKFQSPLGIALVASMLVVVVTGFVGRYYLPQTAMELRQQQSHLATLRSAYEHMASAMSLPDRGCVTGPPCLHRRCRMCPCCSSSMAFPTSNRRSDRAKQSRESSCSGSGCMSWRRSSCMRCSWCMWRPRSTTGCGGSRDDQGRALRRGRDTGRRERGGCVDRSLSGQLRGRSGVDEACDARAAFREACISVRQMRELPHAGQRRRSGGLYLLSCAFRRGSRQAIDGVSRRGGRSMFRLPS